MKEITLADVQAVMVPWVWDIATKTLYDLCSRHPNHRTVEEIIGKVLLIGRSNAAAIERRRKVRVLGDFYELRVGPEMLKANIDSWFNGLEKNGEPGCAKSIEIHRKLQDLFLKISKLSKRSLASKYLHFHFPKKFFIYDSRAARAIRLVTPRSNQLPEIKVKRFDSPYKDFVRRCVWLHRNIQERHEVELSPRQIDRILLKVADRSFRRK